MKLISCYIENFGKLSDCYFDFNKDITCINKENGFGKTTLAVFIKSMFYGLEYKRKKDLYDRTRYLPWNNLNCGGYLIFELNDRVYRIQRTFGKTNKSDTFTLYNENTNTISYDYSENIGEEIWGVDRESFENTVFINIKNNSNLLTEIISNKLNDTIDTKNIDEYQKTYDLLDKKATELYAKRGNKGIIPQKQEKLNMYKRQLLECDVSEKEIQNLETQIKLIDADISILEEKVYKDTKTETENINNNAKLEYITILLNNYNKSCELNSQIDSLEFKLNMIKKNNLIKQDKLKLNNKIALFNFVTLIISIIMFFVSLPIAIVLLLIFVAVEFFALYNIFSLKRNLEEDLFSKITQQIESLNTEKDFLDDTYKEFIIKYNPDDDLENIVKSLMQIKFYLENQNNNNKVQSQNLDLVNKLSKLKADRLLFENKIENLSIKVEEKENIISNIENIAEEIEVLNDRYETLIDTMKYLEIARENLASKYIGGVEKGFEKYLNKLGVSDTDKFKIDINLDVKIQEKGQLYNSDYLSIGGLDLINICTRMALIEAVYKNKEKPILILDDPFVNLDATKLQRAINLLNEISKEYQIIYFTCHNSREI